MDAADLREFYSTRLGVTVRRFIGVRVRRHWPSVAGLNVLGLGYAPPYLDLLQAEAARAIAFMPARRGVVAWPAQGLPAAALVEETELPLLDGSVDRVLCVHCLELADDPSSLLREIWRVLTPQGRALIVVPNRRGMWARFDATPFGHGRPFSRPQLHGLLKESEFAATQWSYALFMPPSARSIVVSSAAAFERWGSWTSPGFSGVLVAEAIKQVHAVSGGRRQRRLAYRLRPALAGALKRGEVEQSR